MMERTDELAFATLIAERPELKHQNEALPNVEFFILREPPTCSWVNAANKHLQNLRDQTEKNADPEKEWVVFSHASAGALALIHRPKGGEEARIRAFLGPGLPAKLHLNPKTPPEALPLLWSKANLEHIERTGDWAVERFVGEIYLIGKGLLHAMHRDLEGAAYEVYCDALKPTDANLLCLLRKAFPANSIKLTFPTLEAKQELGHPWRRLGENLELSGLSLRKEPNVSTDASFDLRKLRALAMTTPPDDSALFVTHVLHQKLCSALCRKSDMIPQALQKAIFDETGPHESSS